MASIFASVWSGDPRGHPWLRLWGKKLKCFHKLGTTKWFISGCPPSRNTARTFISENPCRILRESNLPKKRIYWLNLPCDLDLAWFYAKGLFGLGQLHTIPEGHMSYVKPMTAAEVGPGESYPWENKRTSYSISPDFHYRFQGHMGRRQEICY